LSGPSQSFLLQRGFVDEYYDFVVRLKEVKFDTPALFSIERAARKDIGEIMRLGTENVKHLLSPHRQKSLKEAEQNFIAIFRDLGDWIENEDYTLFVARQRDSGIMTGFTSLYHKRDLLQCSEEILGRTSLETATGLPQGYIFYIAVRHEFEGKYVAQHLTNAGGKALIEKGFKYSAGEFVCQNHAPGAALRKLYRSSYDVEKVQKLKILQ